ncbi:MAG: hypothetical protein LBK50_01430 [Candidatus Nomurabacteria bacterium]|nr:hypothetical protein [Candidatus Nomurabacteria bacterium]
MITHETVANGEINRKQRAHEINIIESGHSFIYGQNAPARQAFLQELCDKYPYEPDSDQPLGIYLTLDDFPRASVIVEKFKEGGHIFAEGYLISAIAEAIEVKTGARLQIDHLGEDRPTFAELKAEQIDYYQKMLRGEVFIEPPDIFLDPSDLMDGLEEFRQQENWNSHITLVIDQQGRFPEALAYAVNRLVSMRISGRLSVNVACDHTEWPTYWLHGSNLPIQSTHDYSTIELDK